MNTFHLIDIENIPVKWPSLIEADSGDKVLIFMLQNPNDKNYVSLDDTIKLVNSDLTMEVITCKNGKPKMNALDFQLISYLGYLIGINKNNTYAFSYRIYSNDTGFDPAIEYWCGCGIDVKRIGTEENEK